MTNSIRRAAQINPRGLATIAGERQHTWPELVARVARLAGALRALGLGADDRVALLAANSDRWLETMYAAYWAGAVLVPLNTRLHEEAIADAIADSEPRLLLLDGLFAGKLDAIRAGCPSLEQVIFLDDGPAPAGALAYEQLLAGAAPAADAGRSGDDLAAIFYTGGTTGDPKGVMISHGNLLANTLNCAHEMGYQREARFLHAAPLFHIGANSSTCALTMHAGTHIFLPPGGFNIPLYLDQLARHRITDVLLVPTMLSMVVNHPEVERYDLSSVRSIQYGGSPITPALLKRAREVFANASFRQFYGMTEVCGSGTTLRPEQHPFDDPESPRLASAGQAMFSVELAIVDPATGAPLAAGSVGEIVIRSPGVMRGYWRRPEVTASIIRDGWLHTGDVGYLDPDGYLYVVDRVKDMIISGGENIYSTEIDQVLGRHPAVLECATIGVPHPTWGEAVHAVVVLRPGETATEGELIEHCRQFLGGYQCPRSVEFRTEPLPVNRAGKILKHVLRASHWRGPRPGEGQHGA